MTGTLYLVPSLLGLCDPATVLPQRTLDLTRVLSHWVVETPKAARAFLRTAGVQQPLATLDIRPLPAAADAAALATLIAPLRAGDDVGMLSDAGCPGVADPGALLVAAAHAAGVRVVPLVGPSAVLLGLMAAGMNGQQFTFHGYLPIKPEARAHALQRLEHASRANRSTELFIETPYRNAAMIDALGHALRPSTIVCIAADLTLGTESIERRTALQWRAQDGARFDKRPALFLLQA